MAEKQLPSSDEVIYSTYPEFEYEYANLQEAETLKPEDQNLIITLTSRKIDGTPVTLISGFVGKRIDLIRLELQLAEACKTCGTTRMYDIILISDVRKRVYNYLRNSGFGVQFAIE